MPEENDFPLEHLDAIKREDLAHVANAMSLEDLEKMKLAEEVFDLHFKRRKRSGKLALATQSVLSLVAIGGIFQNAYQSFQNKKQQDAQQQVDQSRWNQEFERAKAADKYRAFFETSALATDPSNPDKRLVGYALLQEFVQDKDYNGKATLLLEQALDQELGRDKDPGLGEASRSMVVTILNSLSGTNDCKALQQAARSVDGIAKRLSQTHDTEEASEVFGLYVRALVGRAPLACGSFDDVRQVWRPLRDALQRNPVMGGLPPKPTAPQAATRIVEILRDRCLREVQTAGSSDCAEIFQRYAQHCAEHAGTQKNPQVCQILTDTAAKLAAGKTAASSDGSGKG
ncbi:MAG TPA: hypothetical protein VMB50_05995 [Myxococcales bacterium]|nr:hypothetical protein [Myxococcales bacterium]